MRAAHAFSILVLLSALPGCMRRAESEDEPFITRRDELVATRTGISSTENVLANDTSDGEILGVVSWTDAAHGAAAYEGDGIFTYDPHPNAPVGDNVDQFSYVAIDDQGRESEATVRVSIDGGWGEPVPAVPLPGRLSLHSKTRVFGQPLVLLEQWDEDESRFEGLYSSHRVGTEWTSPVRIDGASDAEVDEFWAMSFVSSLGPLVLVYVTEWQDQSTVWGSSFDGNSWAVPQPLFDTHGYLGVESNAIAFDDLGNAFLAFYADAHIRAIRWSPASGWVAATILDAGPNVPESGPRYAGIGGGGFMTCWMQVEAAQAVPSYLCRRMTDGVLGSVRQIAAPGDVRASGHTLGVPGLGIATFVDSTNRLVAVEVPAMGAPSVKSALAGPDPGPNGYAPHVRLASIDSMGRPIVCGYAGTGSCRIRTGASTWSAPISIAGGDFDVSLVSSPEGWSFLVYGEGQSVGRWIEASGVALAPVLLASSPSEYMTLDGTAPASGRAILVGRRDDDSPLAISIERDVVEVHSLPPASPVAVTTPLSEGGDLEPSVRCDVDEAGNFWVAYGIPRENGTRDLFAARRLAGQAWEATEHVATLTGRLVDVDVDAAGIPSVLVEELAPGNQGLVTIDRR